MAATIGRLAVIARAAFYVLRAASAPPRRRLADDAFLLYISAMVTMLMAVRALPEDFQLGLENLLEIVGKGDNMPIAGLIPIIIFFTWLALREAFRHDRLIAQGRDDEVLDQMYK